MKIKATYLLIFVFLFLSGFTRTGNISYHSGQTVSTSSVSCKKQHTEFTANQTGKISLYDDLLCYAEEDDDEFSSVKKKTSITLINTALNTAVWQNDKAVRSKQCTPGNSSFYNSKKYIFERVLRV